MLTSRIFTDCLDLIVRKMWGRGCRFYCCCAWIPVPSISFLFLGFLTHSLSLSGSCSACAVRLVNRCVIMMLFYLYPCTCHRDYCVFMPHILPLLVHNVSCVHVLFYLSYFGSPTSICLFISFCIMDVLLSVYTVCTFFLTCQYLFFWVRSGICTVY